MIEPHLLPDVQLHSKPVSIDPGFFFADGTTLGKLNARSAFNLPLAEGERRRLVEAAKSPTRTREAILAKIRWDLREKSPAKKITLVDGDEYRRERETKLEKFREKPQNNVGSKTIIQFREWSDEWRIRTQVDTTVGTKPPDRSGIREGVFLSDRGARKIADSCAYMAAKNGGYKTFVTGTFDSATREKIAAGATTIQREVTRTMDALTKMYSRGWVRSDGREVEAKNESLAYCWVVEVPKNEAGEDNPHVHMLLDWSVEFTDFKEWAARIENIWGNGYFHLEKIVDPLCAGAYMAKAAGYISKASGADDQGNVRGNRYAISKRARAPEWYTIGTFELGVMGHLIREVYDGIQARHAAKFAERKRLNEQRDAIRERAKKQQAEHPKKKYPLWAKHARDRIGAALMAVREKINAIPVRASKYQLILKSQEIFWRFMGWAKACGWSWNARPDSHWMARFRKQLYTRKRLRDMWRSQQELADAAERKINSVRESLSSWGLYSMENRHYGGAEILV
jgi:hypothetical protein